jgi:tRNA (guanine-N7-)-methyltransferase
MAEQEKQRRPIRSYVLREGRLTRGQQRAFKEFWPRFGIDFHRRRLDLVGLYGNPNPVYLEIGFGNGESIARMAQTNPENNYLGIEVHRPGVGRLLLQTAESGLTNLRIMRHDAVEVLDNCLDDASLEAVYLFFPDPWHKRRHRKRRILQPEFVARLARVIRPGGMFHAATDWEDYAQSMMSVLTASTVFENCAGKGIFAPRPEYRFPTRFEERGQRLGHGVWDLVFRRL